MVRLFFSKLVVKHITVLTSNGGKFSLELDLNYIKAKALIQGTLEHERQR